MSEPVSVRNAATVVMMRPHPDGFAVFVQRRPTSMAFAGGMYVFPGGATEPGDSDAFDTAVREAHEETGVLLHRSTLLPWSRWITPAGEVRRFDAMFFVTPLPPGQEPQPRGTEMDAVAWLTPTQVLDRFAAGELVLMQPTEVTLRELAAYPDVPSVLAAAPSRSLTAVRP